MFIQLFRQSNKWVSCSKHTERRLHLSAADAWQNMQRILTAQRELNALKCSLSQVQFVYLKFGMQFPVYVQTVFSFRRGSKQHFFQQKGAHPNSLYHKSVILPWRSKWVITYICSCRRAWWVLSIPWWYIPSSAVI